MGFVLARIQALQKVLKLIHIQESIKTHESLQARLAPGGFCLA